MNQIEQDQIRLIQAAKSSAMLELAKRKSEEKKMRDDLELDIVKILEETAEGLDAMDNEDLVSQISNQGKVMWLQHPLCGRTSPG